VVRVVLVAFWTQGLLLLELETHQVFLRHKATMAALAFQAPHLPVRAVVAAAQAQSAATPLLQLAATAAQVHLIPLLVLRFSMRVAAVARTTQEVSAQQARVELAAAATAVLLLAALLALPTEAAAVAVAPTRLTSTLAATVVLELSYCAIQASTQSRLVLD
jgi:soluble lytic murein transglycosylase-like protein